MRAIFVSYSGAKKSVLLEDRRIDDSEFLAPVTLMCCKTNTQLRIRSCASYESKERLLHEKWPGSPSLPTSRQVPTYQSAIEMKSTLQDRKVRTGAAISQANNLTPVDY